MADVYAPGTTDWQTNYRLQQQGQKNATKEQSDLQKLVFGGLPGEDAFYSGQIARAQRALGAQGAGLRSAALQNLEARGLGRSSEVGRTLQGLAMDQGQRLDDVIGDVGAQQFSARQQRVNAYLSYLYAKKLNKDNKSGFDPFSFLLKAGTAAGNIWANSGGGGDPYAVTGSTPVQQNDQT
jgi:hypothetical protein